MAFVQSTFIQNAAAATTIVVTPTSTPTNGDILIIGVSQADNGTFGCSSSGWSAITAGLTEITLPTTGNYFSFLYKVAGPSEPSSYTVTLNTVAVQATAQFWEFSGRNTSAPFTATNYTTVASGGHPLSIAVPGVTAAAGGDLLWCCMLGNNGVACTPTAPSGFINLLNASGGTSSQLSAAGCTNTNVSAGATGTLTGSETWGGANTDAAGVIISIAAATGVGPGPLPQRIWQMP